MTASPVRIQLRLFAAARAAAGRSEITVELDAASAPSATVATALHALAPRTAELETVLGRCTFLVNGVAATGPEQPVADGDRVDVLPPFAGG